MKDKALPGRPGRAEFLMVGDTRCRGARFRPACKIVVFPAPLGG